jgi:endonuclease YncB( thermonuclease family)
MRALVLGLALLAATAAHASNQPIMSGPAYAVDGDTLRIAGQSIRLEGVDAFEKAQTCGEVACGRQAAEFTRRLVADSIVVCQRTDVDRYGRWVARCTIGARDIGREIVRAGWGLAYVKYSRAYVAEEGQARAARAGVWAGGDFTAPWDWRAARRAAS